MDKTLTKEDVLTIVKDYNKSSAFTDRKLTDIPTDALSVVNKKYVTANGSVLGRPSSVLTVGQFYLDTNSNIPMWKVSAGWANGVGSIVAGNR